MSDEIRSKLRAMRDGTASVRASKPIEFIHGPASADDAQFEAWLDGREMWAVPADEAWRAGFEAGQASSARELSNKTLPKLAVNGNARYTFCTPGCPDRCSGAPLHEERS